MSLFIQPLARPETPLVDKNGRTTLPWTQYFQQLDAYIRLLNISLGSSALTNSLGASVNLNNTANYFTGPQVAQGTAGTWYVSGSVTVLDSAGAAGFLAKLWDGTTIIASGVVTTTAANQQAIIALSGIITSPAANLRISVRDNGSVNGLISFNSSGNSKDSTITAFRIG